MTACAANWRCGRALRWCRWTTGWLGASLPAAVDDSWAALAWLRRHAESAGPQRQTARHRWRQRGRHAVSRGGAACARPGLAAGAAVTITPGTLAHTNTASLSVCQWLPVDAATIEWFFFQPLPAPRPTARWRFAPMDAEDHEGLAPAFVLLAEV